MIFKQLAMAAIFLFFQMRLKFCRDMQRHIFIAINILCKFGENIFIDE